MPKLGDIVVFVTDQGLMRMGFVSSEVIEPLAESEEERLAREQALVDADVAAEAEKKRQAEVLAAQAEAAKVAHAEAEARAGGPIQRVVVVQPDVFAPVSVVPPPVVEEEKPTGPVLTLHVLLHPSDQDYASLGSFGVYAGVKHSDKNVPHTWH